MELGVAQCGGAKKLLFLRKRFLVHDWGKKREETLMGESLNIVAKDVYSKLFNFHPLFVCWVKLIYLLIEGHLSP